MNAVHNGEVDILFENDVVRVIPVILQKDGTLLKPGLQKDILQGFLVGALIQIDNRFIQANENPSRELLKSIFVTEADVTCLSTYDGKVALPCGFDLTNAFGSAESIKSTLIDRVREAQICLNHVNSRECLDSTKVIITSSPSCNSNCDGKEMIVIIDFTPIDRFMIPGSERNK